MYEIAGDLETANNNLIRNANNKTSGLYASNFQKGNLSKYQTMSLIHNSTVSDQYSITLSRIHHREGLNGGRYRCQLSVKISAICQLPHPFFKGKALGTRLHVTSHLGIPESGIPERAFC